MTSVLQRWKEGYLSSVQGQCKSSESVDRSTDLESLPPVLETEVTEAIRHLQRGKRLDMITSSGTAEDRE